MENGGTLIFGREEKPAILFDAPVRLTERIKVEEFRRLRNVHNSIFTAVRSFLADRPFPWEGETFL